MKKKTRIPVWHKGCSCYGDNATESRIQMKWYFRSDYPHFQQRSRARFPVLIYTCWWTDISFRYQQELQQWFCLHFPGGEQAV